MRLAVGFVCIMLPSMPLFRMVPAVALTLCLAIAPAQAQFWGNNGWGNSWGGGAFGGGDDTPRPTRPAAYMGVMFDVEKDDLRVDDLSDKGPAQKAGLKVGDVITEIDGIKLKKRGDLFDHMRKKKAGDTITVLVERGGKKETVKIKLEPRPAD